ncbi:MAG: formylglycine-generating enzyme family protein [Acidobacteria bacterium]|nr:formylglycine-generating enzyme family protein [Acidobacteriota bacterium]
MAQIPAWNQGIPAHPVTISRTPWFQTTEVTQGQWLRVMGTRPWREAPTDPSSRLLPGALEGESFPVQFVSWEDAQEFMSRLEALDPSFRYRLPTEAEWEYACRAGARTRYPTGDEEGVLAEFGWYAGREGHPEEARPKVAASKKPNAWGIFDMHGNLGEWCQDWLEPRYPAGPQTDPEGPASGFQKVCRGGSYLSAAGDAGSASREALDPRWRSPNTGFRVVSFPR